MSFGLVLRAALEDRMRSEELEGFADYCDRVRVRLLPFMWMRSDFPPPGR